MKDAVSPNSWIKQIKAYFWVGQPPHHGAYGPLKLVVYAGISIDAIFFHECDRLNPICQRMPP